MTHFRDQFVAGVSAGVASGGDGFQNFSKPISPPNAPHVKWL